MWIGEPSAPALLVKQERAVSTEEDTVRLVAAVKTLCSWGSGSVRIGTPKSVDMEAQ